MKKKNLGSSPEEGIIQCRHTLNSGKVPGYHCNVYNGFLAASLYQDLIALTSCRLP